MRHGSVYARGALDDKGQTFYTLIALKTLLEETKELPCNVKWIIEGEEESGSAGLRAILPKIKEQIRADHFVIIDSGLGENGAPAITLGARGIVTMTVTFTGSKFDLHSGTAGGIVYNPNRALVEVLASLYDEKGRVAIEGFYDDVVDLSEAEKKELALNFDPKSFEKQFESKVTGGEKGYPPLENAWLRPVIEINGISGGYGGAGFKTVIPAKAVAKISCRLVPDQDPEKIARLVKNYLETKTKGSVKVDVQVDKGLGKPFRTRASSKIARSTAMAYEEVFKAPTANILIGGSIPIGAELAKCAGGEMLLMGMGLADDQIHSPDEHFGWDRFEKGYLVICKMLENLAN